MRIIFVKNWIEAVNMIRSPEDLIFHALYGDIFESYVIAEFLKNYMRYKLCPFWGPFKQKRHLRKFRKCLKFWCRGIESNCRHGDFQTKFLIVQKWCNYNQLILFQFFIVFWVSFGTIWKYLTLTGTIWAQSHSPETLLHSFSGHSASRLYQ